MMDGVICRTAFALATAYGRKWAKGLRAYRRQFLPWDYFRIARDPGRIAKLIPCHLPPSSENSLVARFCAIELFSSNVLALWFVESAPRSVRIYGGWLHRSGPLLPFRPSRWPA